MKEKMEQSKCKRGQKFCGNSECSRAIPIHTYICSFCKYINKKEKKRCQIDKQEIAKINQKHLQNKIVNKKNLQQIRDYYLRRLFEVIIFFSNLGSSPF
jgi:hypothetical protein